MKTNELNNGIKEVYTKPALEVEEMEMQWNYCVGDNDDTSAEGDLLDVDDGCPEP